MAVVQAAPVAFDVERTLQKLADLTADAARRGAQLALFPEAFVSAYPRGLDFGAVVGSRTPEGREQFRRLLGKRHRGARARRGSARPDSRAPTTRTLSSASSSASGGTLYCTALFFGPDGRYLGKHRKLMPTGSERLVWGFGDGSTLPVVDTRRSAASAR